MGIESTEVEVDGISYNVTQYTGGKSIRLLVKLVKVGGKSFGYLMSMGLDGKVDGEAIAGALDALSMNTNPDDFEKLAKEILEGVMVKGLEDVGYRKLIFDTDFSGKIGHLFRVLKAVMLFQYADFLAGLAVNIPVSTAKETKAGVNRIKAK
jgi:hypothetical protein